MKKALVIFCSVVSVSLSNYYSFSQKQTKKPASKETSKTSTAKAGSSAGKGNLSKADIEQGKELISKSDCLACHQVNAKVVGPAYSAVADKYPATEANIKKLSEKVIKGGSGSWGSIPMTPHPAISSEDARKMVAYVLSVNSK
jgi:cytochrome c